MEMAGVATAADNPGAAAARPSRYESQTFGETCATTGRRWSWLGAAARSA